MLAPSAEYKGVQREVLTEGRYYYNPYDWGWQVVPQVEIPDGKLGVRIRMYGEDLPAGELIACEETTKRESCRTCCIRAAIRSTPAWSTRRRGPDQPSRPGRTTPRSSNCTSR